MMATISSFGLYLLATLLFMSGVNNSLAMTNNAAENIPHAADPKETSKEDILEMAIQSVMRAVEDGFARTAREVREIKEEVKSLEEGIKSLEEKLTLKNNATVCPTESDPTPPEITGDSCYDLNQRGHIMSGLYSVVISGKQAKVYCDMESDGGGWTVIQRRDNIEPHVDFERGWKDYKRGFGDLGGEFWLGLDTIHVLTSDPSTPMRLRVDLEDWEGQNRVALYHTFMVQDEEKKYNLTVEGYEKGPEGDPRDSLAYHNGRAFSTKDRDNDGWSGGNCAERDKGGWWYNGCHHSNLNGVYLKGEHGQWGQGVYWAYWKGQYYSLKRVAMKIRPR